MVGYADRGAVLDEEQVRAVIQTNGIFNPALAIIQSVFDSVDPINYARRIRLRRQIG